MTLLLQLVMPDLIIPNGTAVSQTIDWQQDMFDAEAFTIQAPHVLDAVTLTMQVSSDGVNFGTLKDLTGTAIKVPSAIDDAICYNGVVSAIKFFRLLASGNVAADRHFSLVKSYRA
jgi:hypothetical protein